MDIDITGLAKSAAEKQAQGWNMGGGFGYGGIGYPGFGYGGIGYPGFGRGIMGYPGFGYGGIGYPGFGRGIMGYPGFGGGGVSIWRSPWSSGVYYDPRMFWMQQMYPQLGQQLANQAAIQTGIMAEAAPAAITAENPVIANARQAEIQRQQHLDTRPTTYLETVERASRVSGDIAEQLRNLNEEEKEIRDFLARIEQQRQQARDRRMLLQAEYDTAVGNAQIDPVAPEFMNPDGSIRPSSEGFSNRLYRVFGHVTRTGKDALERVNRARANLQAFDQQWAAEEAALKQRELSAQQRLASRAAYRQYLEEANRQRMERATGGAFGREDSIEAERRRGAQAQHDIHIAGTNIVTGRLPGNQPQVRSAGATPIQPPVSIYTHQPSTLAPDASLAPNRAPSPPPVVPQPAPPPPAPRPAPPPSPAPRPAPPPPAGGFEHRGSAIARLYALTPDILAEAAARSMFHR
jgi:hypothetical protein